VEDKNTSLLKLSTIFQLISSNFGNLKTWENWVDLYMILFSRRFRGNKKILESLGSEPEFHPHCFNDLVHKTTMYFQSLHNVRLPFAEAQKRVSSTVCSLTGWEPTNEVKYHGFGPTSDASPVKMSSWFSENSALTTDQDNPDYKIQNTGQRASILMTTFRFKDEPQLTKTAIACAREQSKRWAKANNKNQNRDWHQIVSELCNDPGLRRIVLPCTIDLEITNEKTRLTSDAFHGWVHNMRDHVLSYLYEKEKDISIFQNELLSAEKTSSKRTRTEDTVDTAAKFVDFCLNTKIDTTKKKKKKIIEEQEKDVPERILKKELKEDGGIALARLPSPQMILMITTIFCSLASGSKSSIEAISKVASLNGKRVANPRYKDDIRFMDLEFGFKTGVSWTCRVFVSKRKSDIRRKMLSCRLFGLNRKDDIGSFLHRWLLKLLSFFSFCNQ
jgi:hypothetical protein